MTAAVITVILFILQLFGVFSFFGINPNLVFVGLLFFAFRNDQLRSLLVLFAITAILVAVFTPVWIIQFVAVFIVVVVLRSLKGFMTGSRMFDFLVGILPGTFLFYLLANFFEFNASYALILKEAVYNMIVGAVIWHIIPEHEKRV